MIAFENESDCEHNFYEIYPSKSIKKEKKHINNLKKTSSSDSLQSFASNVVEHDYKNIDNIDKENDIVTNKIKFKIFDDVDFVSMNTTGNFEISMCLPSSLNIISINKIILSSKISVSDINILSNKQILFEKNDIVSLNFSENKLNCSECIKDILINMIISNKNVNQIIGKIISVTYTSQLVKDKSASDLL